MLCFHFSDKPKRRRCGNAISRPSQAILALKSMHPACACGNTCFNLKQPDWNWGVSFCFMETTMTATTKDEAEMPSFLSAEPCTRNVHYSQPLPAPWCVSSPWPSIMTTLDQAVFILGAFRSLDLRLIWLTATAAACLSIPVFETLLLKFHEIPVKENEAVVGHFSLRDSLDSPLSSLSLLAQIGLRRPAHWKLFPSLGSCPPCWRTSDNESEWMG